MSGRFLLRVPAEVHGRLHGRARESGVSLNEWCNRALRVPGPSLLGEDGAVVTVERALAALDDRLVGLVVYGSYARGDATPASDVDVLVVVDRLVALSRSLYRAWDGEPVRWGGRAIDPHFVHLPADRSGAGPWAEAAIDGVVLLERDGAVTRQLAATRGALAAGRLVRRTVHGQPYWTAVT